VRHVLLVDDDPLIRDLARHVAPRSVGVSMLTASEGREALEILAREPIDVLITDLKMPGMDGFELLTRVQKEYPQVPVIVLSGMSVEEIRPRLGEDHGLRLLSKPVRLETLREEIAVTLQRRISGFVANVSLAGFVQLVEMERKSCRLDIRSGQESGRLSFRDGELLDASAGELGGNEAALEIFSWPEVDIEISGASTSRMRTIDRPLRFLIMEAARIADERRWKEVSPRQDLDPLDWLEPLIRLEGYRAACLRGFAEGIRFIGSGKRPASEEEKQLLRRSVELCDTIATGDAGEWGEVQLTLTDVVVVIRQIPEASCLLAVLVEKSAHNLGLFRLMLTRGAEELRVKV